MLFWGKIFCFGVSERHGVRSRMLLCDNGLERAAGRHRQSLIGPDSDKGGDVANTQLTVPYTFFLCVCVGRKFAFQVGLQPSLRGGTGTAAFDTNAHNARKKERTLAANNKEQMNNKTNHTINTRRRGTLTIYHKSASGEKLNSCAVRCKTEKEIHTNGERESCAP